MKFTITRTSGKCEANGAPCEEAKRDLVEKWQVRTIDEEGFNKKFGKYEGLWRSAGKNHKILENGWIARQLGDEEDWVVEFNTLEELFKFSEKYGELVFSKSNYGNQGEIEIYDDYRE